LTLSDSQPIVFKLWHEVTPHLRPSSAIHLSREVPGRLKFFGCLVHCGEGWRGEGGVALGGRGGAGEEGVEDVVDEGLLLESG
jgi:hypothetical protein